MTDVKQLPAEPFASAGDAVGTVWHGDALELLRKLPDASIDLVLTDPPYGNFSLDEWDKAPPITTLVNEFQRVLKDGGFVALTCQMPSKLDWMNAFAGSALRWREEIVWLKRVTGRYRHGLVNTHETLLIYAKGAADYHETKGRYSDVKVPGLMFDAISIEGLQRAFDVFWSEANTGKKQTISSGQAHKVHLSAYRRHETPRAPEFANFTNVWSFMPQNGFNEAIDHPSVKPIGLFERALRCFMPTDGIVLDPFAGSGTTAVAARNLGRKWIVSDITPEYCTLMQQRLDQPYTPDMFVAMGVGE